MEIQIGIGKELQTVNIPDHNLIDVLYQNDVDVKLSEQEEVLRALHEPIGTKPLRELVKPGQKIAIATSDSTRPMPTKKVMPAILEELYAGGVKPEDITLVFAIGSHRKLSEKEMIELAGEDVFRQIRCINSNPDDCIHLGDTKKGTPVDIFREMACADVKICMGNIEYHYFAGYSGGVKSMMPGCSTRDAIQVNHKMMIDPRACAGNLDDNPLREDLEEAGDIAGIDFILNLVLDEHKKIIKAVAGHVKKAHREGCKFLDTLYQKEISQQADIVITSQGGAPKDLNLYQTQKALDNAKHAVKEGGTIILVGSCREGLGESHFEQWLMEAEKPADLISRVREHFVLGGHKAAAIAMVMEKADVYLVSHMDDQLVKNVFMTPFANVQDAYEAAAAKYGEKASVIVMPYGGSTLPRLVNKGGKEEI